MNYFTEYAIRSAYPVDTTILLSIDLNRSCIRRFATFVLCFQPRKKLLRRNYDERQTGYMARAAVCSGG
jgi:hypothetical protein